MPHAINRFHSDLAEKARSTRVRSHRGRAAITDMVTRAARPIALLIAATAVSVGCSTDAVSTDNDGADQLKAGFAAPPAEARPRVWWHWMNGNITQDGIAKDLAWMQRIGIGGVQNFDAAMETPIVVDQRLAYMTPPWKKAFRFAVKRADELGLEFSVASSAGWSETGGPWVTPDDAMKKLVWSETLVSGGQLYQGTLPQPPAVVGPFHTLKATYKFPPSAKAIPASYYRDAVVLAYPVTGGDADKSPQAVTANGNPLDLKTLIDADLTTGVVLPENKDHSFSTIDVRYEHPQTVQSAVLYIANVPSSIFVGPLLPRLEALTADNTWESVAQFRLTKVPTTLSFKPVTATQFRLVFARGPLKGSIPFQPAPGVDPAGIGGIGSSAEKALPLLADFRLSSQAKISYFEEKAGFSIADNYHAPNTSVTPDGDGIPPQSVVDLTEKMTATGQLEWQVPPGQWKVLRLGYSLTGKTNAPATQEATGLEVDKYDAEAVQRYLRHYLQMYRETVGDELIGKRGLNALVNDSIEVGPSNWTPKMREQFLSLRGYDPTPWLPTLTGDIVGSRVQSDLFLYDFRHTLAQLIASEHYGTVARIAHENQLTVYGESLEGDRHGAALGDDLEMRRFADIPMAAMWTYGKAPAPASRYIADMRGAASVAHLYGKRYVAAESLTSIVMPWAHAPAELQPMIDATFLNGVNRTVIHTSAHQPVDDKIPGLSVHGFGQFFTRHETWAEMAKPWIDYIARNNFLLQQGRNVADVAYFHGEEPPLSILANEKYPNDVPIHYAYDFIPADALLNELSVDKGDLVTRSGARYKVLYLGGSSTRFMTLPLLKRIAVLVDNGATLIGSPPTASPSLHDSHAEFTSLVKRLWSGQHNTVIGKGRVIESQDVEAVLTDLNIGPDFTTESNAPVQFVHRRLADGDLYYLANRGEARQINARFRISGRAPEIWHADTGAISDASYQTDNGATVVPLSMKKNESLFVIFRTVTNEKSRVVVQPVLTATVPINGDWKVHFQPNRGAPEQTTLDTLQSLSEHKDVGIKYFSGVATYLNHVELSAEQVGSNQLQIDLGNVGDIAEVYINGQYAGAAWKPPYRVEISRFAKAGSNSIEIRVANLWVNRLIGDKQPNAKKVAYTTFSTYRAQAPLRPSGLIGPVVITTFDRP